MQWICLFQGRTEFYGCASPGCEFQNTGFGVSLTLNAKFAGVGILTEPFVGGKKECFEREVFESMKAVSCMKGYIPIAHTNVAV